MLNVISLGAGVQSSVMALMAARGELEPTVDACIFADTGGEPESVYSFLSYLEEELPFPVYRVKHKEGLTKGINDIVKDRDVYMVEIMEIIKKHSDVLGGLWVRDGQYGL